ARLWLVCWTHVSRWLGRCCHPGGRGDFLFLRCLARFASRPSPLPCFGPPPAGLRGAGRPPPKSTLVVRTSPSCPPVMGRSESIIFAGRRRRLAICREPPAAPARFSGRGGRTVPRVPRPGGS